MEFTDIVCVCVCMYVYIYIYIYNTEREREMLYEKKEETSLVLPTVFIRWLSEWSDEMTQSSDEMTQLRQFSTKFKYNYFFLTGNFNQ